MKHVALLCLLAGPALADCPAAPDHSDAIAAALERLSNTQTAMAARDVTGELWGYWLDAPDELAQELLDEGMSRRESFDFLGSLNTLTRLVDYCPNYAEGYNQRAFTFFVTNEFEPALRDLERAVELNPTHIGAVSGMGLVLIRLGRDAEGQVWLRRAVALNPHLSERALLAEPPGDDI